MQKMLYKMFGILSGVFAAKVARSVMESGWKRTHGGANPPRQPDAPGTRWSEAIAWAVASGVAAGVARLLATKSTASAWRKATGHLPPGLEDVGN